MKLYKWFISVMLLAGLAGTVSALEFKFTPARSVSQSLQNDIDSMVSDLNSEIKDIDEKPEDFIRAFADASVFSSHGATQRAYGDYKLWALTIGPTVGIRVPGSPFDAMDILDGLQDKLEQEGDLGFGMNPQALSFQFGLNTSGFLLDRLYLGLRFGYFHVGFVDDLDFKTLHIGPVAQYQLVKGASFGPFKWRGLSVGTGFLFQKTTAAYEYVLDSEESGDASIKDPTINFDMDIKTFTVPLEANTAVQVLWFLNIGLGVGADLSFGKNDLSLSAAGDVYENTTGTYLGKLSTSGGGTMKPTLFNPKVMTSLGLKFGPVIIDVPITYYFGKDAGASFGVTVGASW